MASEEQGLHSPSQLWCAISFCLICRSACWLSLSIYIWFDNDAIGKSFTASSSLTFRITCAATKNLYRVRNSNLSGLRSKSLPIRHFYSQEKYAQWNKNVSESIIEHENHERDRDMSDKTKKKKDSIGLERHNRTTWNQIQNVCLTVLHAILYTTQIDRKLKHQVYIA